MFSEVDSGLDSNPFLEAIDLSKSGHVINEHKKAWNAGRRRDVALFGDFENTFKAFIEEGD